MLSICKYLISVMCSAKRADRKAFSLVEALVASLIVGYCLLPVVGTMQSGEKLTERIVHSEKLRMLARSRLNLETSAANNEQKLINTSPNYHYVYLKSGSDQLQFIDTNLAPASFSLDTSVEEVVYTYEVNVAVDDDVYLEPAVGLPAKYVRGLNGLKSLVVTAKLLPNGTDVEEELTFTLVSLITVPMVSQQHAWAIDARQNKVLSFDPYSGMLNLTKTIDFPTPANLHLRPSFVFPHPNDKTVFVYSAAGAYGLNTDNSDSTYYAGLATYTAPTTPGRFSLDTSKNTSVRNYLSRPFLMAMRPDGKYIYSMSKASDGDIFADGYASSTLSVVNPSGQSLVSNLTYVYGSVNTSNVNFLVAGADGNLYFGPVPKIGDSTVSVLGRMPMYGLQLPKYQELRNPASATHDMSDAAVSPDGETLCLLFKPNSGTDYLLVFFDSKSAAPIVKSELNAVTATAITDMEYSGDGRYICLVDKNSGMYLFDTTVHNLYSSGNNLASLPYAKAPGSMKPEYAVYSQETNSFIIDDVASSSVISLDCEEFAANKYSAKIPDENIFQLAPNSDSIVHVNTRKTDYLYAIASESESFVHCIDQYSGTVDPTREIALSAAPHDIALSAMGDKLSVTYGDALKKVETYDVINNSKTLDKTVADKHYIIAPLNEGYDKTQRGNTVFSSGRTISKSTSTTDTDSSVTKPIYAFDFANIDTAQNEEFGLDASWNIKKIIGLNNGGFLTLAGKADGTSLIDWFGRNSVGSYTRNARWISGVTAKKQSKELPEQMLDDTSVTAGPDTWVGYTIIYAGSDIPVGSKISKVRFVAAGCSTTPKYVTPVLLEEQGTPGTYKVKDFAQAILVTEDGETEESIAWKVNGIIQNKKYYPGLWSGNTAKGEVNAGIVKYNTSIPGLFKSGIGKDASGTDSSPLTIDKSIAVKTPSSDRNYQIQFVVEESLVATEKFPPKFTQDIAISRDDRVLTLATSDSVSQSVKFYDFAAHDFGSETQLKGMVADYRIQTIDLSQSPVKSGLSHSLSTNNLIRAITSNETNWNSIRNYPANYVESGVPSTETKKKSDKRFFGYYSSYDKNGAFSPVKSFAAATTGKTRVFIDQICKISNALPSAKDNFRVNYPQAYESLIQFEQGGQDPKVVKKLTAYETSSSTTAGDPIPGWSPLRNYLTPDPGQTMNYYDKDTANSMPEGFNDERLFNHLWSGDTYEFKYPVSATDYIKIDLLFCDTFCTSVGQRKFDVEIEGTRVEKDLDVFKVAGGINRGIIKTYNIKVTDGELKIKFIKKKENPLISGIILTYDDASITTTSFTQSGGIFTNVNSDATSGAITTAGTGYDAINNMAAVWNTIASESVTPFRFEPVYMGEEEIYPATNYLYRKMLFGRDVASPTLFLFSNRRVTSTAGKALEIRRVHLNGATEKKDYSGLVMTDVAISEDGQNIFVSAAKDLRKINVAASLGDTERIATFSSSVTHLANKPFVRYKSTPASGAITDLGTVFTEARWGSNNAVIASGGIYIAGGTDSSGNALNKIYQYDVFANNLTWVATLSESLSKHSMAAYDDSLYLFNGSSDAASFTESVSKYCLDTKTQINSTKGHEESVYKGDELVTYSPTGKAGPITKEEKGSVTYSLEPDGNTKVVSWNNGDKETKDVPRAFDGKTNNEWVLGRYDGSRRYVQVTYTTAVCVDKVRLLTDKKKDISIYKLFASTNGSTWTLLKEVKDPYYDSTENISNSVSYEHYKVEFYTPSNGREAKIKELTFYGTTALAIGTKTIPDTGMHRTLDDNLAPVAVTNNAACTTPYGIMVAGGYAGSGFVESSSNPGTTTALIYWPHAIGGVYEETNDKLYGISRSVPSLPEPSVDNCMVWHKGKVYCFGGIKTSGTTEFHLPFIFNFETNTWSKANSAILGVGHLKRRKAAAVSFGDEIFLFGGECSVNTSFAVAWNTSTNVVREVFSAPPAKLGKYNVSAAAFGSHIYLFGGRDSVSTSVGAKNGIYRFTP